jgi:DNA ligase-1
MKFRPMLAASQSISEADVPLLKYPIMVSPKLDGIRCLITEAGPVTRNLKPIPNKFIRDKLSCLPVGLDGELIVGKMTGLDVWNRTQSGVMSEDGEPDFIFHVFDFFEYSGPFEDRLREARNSISFTPPTACPVYHLPHEKVWMPERLHKLEEHAVNQGFEGIMIRDPAGAYKHGRATRKEATLLKYKRFEDAEAIIVGFKERMHNANEAKVNALGLTERSTHKANKVGTDTLGAFCCRMIDEGRVIILNSDFDLSSFTDEQRASFWERRDSLIHKVVKFKFQGLTPDGKPRFPIFLGFRDEGDL